MIPLEVKSKFISIFETKLILQAPSQELQETWVWSLGQENPLEEGMASHLSILAWWIPWTEEPGGLQSMGLQRVRHDWVTCPTKSWIFIWWIDFLIIIKWPYLSLVILFTLKFTLTDIKIATLALFLIVLIWFIFSIKLLIFMSCSLKEVWVLVKST